MPAFIEPIQSTFPLSQPIHETHKVGKSKPSIQFQSEFSLFMHKIGSRRIDIPKQFRDHLSPAHYPPRSELRYKHFYCENRVRIATESAGALAYLHCAASIPVFRRDIKSTNILLNENYVSKISDFGASRLVPFDETHVTTLVQGTLGYLDPEYLRTSQLTAKSDVYSFGVVLAELLTGRKPLLLESEVDRNLATQFIMAAQENRLFEILEPRVVKEGTSEQLKVAGQLVMRCLSLNGEERPTMNELAIELEAIRRYGKQPRPDESEHEEEALMSHGAQQ